MGVPLIGADSRLDVDTTTVSPGAATGFPEAGLTDDRLFTLYKMVSASGSLVIKTDALADDAATVGYFMMVGHNFGTIGGTTVTFERSNDDISYTNIFTEASVADDFIIARAFTNVTGQFFRLTISKGSAFTGQIGQLAWGKPVRFPFGVPVPFDPNAESLNARFGRSQSGNILGFHKIFTERRATLVLPFQPSTFVDGTSLGDFREWWDANGQKGDPFLWMWNADILAATTAFEKDSFFGVVDPGNINRQLTTQLATGLRDLELEIVGLKENA